MFRILDKSHDSKFAIEADGTITEEDVAEAAKTLEEAIDKYGKISWMLIWKSPSHETPGALYADMMWLFKNIKKFDRMAIVGDSSWKRLLVEADGAIFGEKYFDVSEQDKAWAYVEGG